MDQFLLEVVTMACFLVPAAEAAVVTIATQILIAHENKILPKYKREENARLAVGAEKKAPFSQKLRWLSNLLWGGAFLLAFEHVWHGEVVPWFPFLTAASNPADASVMLHEMSTVGVTMAVLVTAVWAVMVLVSNAMTKKTLSPVAVTK
jgi:hypothetical protein